MTIALAIAAFTVISAQLVLLAYVAHARERAGARADHFQELAVDLRDRIAAAAEEESRLHGELAKSSEAVATLTDRNARLTSVVQITEAQRDEALHELEATPDPSGRAVAARIRSRLQDLSALSGAARATTSGGDGGEAVHGPAKGTGHP